MKEPRRLVQVGELGESRTSLLFKHSPRCRISDTVLEEVREVASGHASLEFFIVDVVRDRALSREVAEAFRIRHESPQVILFKDGEAVWYGSHFDATPRALEEAIRKAM